MPDGVTVKLEGFAQLERNLQQLDEKVARRAIIDAAKAGAGVLRNSIAASARARFKTTDFLKHLKINWRIRGRGVKGAVVWFNVGLTDDAFYGRMQEKSYHAIGRGKGRRFRHRRLLKKGGGLGKVYKKPFMGPSFEIAWPFSLAAVEAKLREFFEQYRSQL